MNLKIQILRYCLCSLSTFCFGASSPTSESSNLNSDRLQSSLPTDIGILEGRLHSFILRYDDTGQTERLFLLASQTNDKARLLDLVCSVLGLFRLFDNPLLDPFTQHHQSDSLYLRNLVFERIFNHRDNIDLSTSDLNALIHCVSIIRFLIQNSIWQTSNIFINTNYLTVCTTLIADFNLLMPICVYLVPIQNLGYVGHNCILISGISILYKLIEDNRIFDLLTDRARDGGYLREFLG